MEKVNYKGTSLKSLIDFINNDTSYRCHTPFRTSTGYIIELESETLSGESIIDEIEFSELTKESLMLSLDTYDKNYRGYCNQEIKNRAASSDLTIWELAKEASRLINQFHNLVNTLVREQRF